MGWANNSNRGPFWTFVCYCISALLCWGLIGPFSEMNTVMNITGPLWQIPTTFFSQSLGIAASYMYLFSWGMVRIHNRHSKTCPDCIYFAPGLSQRMRCSWSHHHLGLQQILGRNQSPRELVKLLGSLAQSFPEWDQFGAVPVRKVGLCGLKRR